MEDTIALAVALVADRLLGEPPARAHPVVWIGSACRALTGRLELGRRPLLELAWGACVGVGIPTTTYLIVRAVLSGSTAVPGLAIVLAAYFAKASFAVRALAAAGDEMAAALAAGDLARARRGLGSLCSRDASPLGPEELAAGTVESLAENASDSIVAPLFWLAVGGVPLAMAYRAVNTLDAMIGYHGRHEHLGKVAARLDDVANWVPARLTAALFLVVGAAAAGPDAGRGWRIARRDARLTESPNAGWPMATMAGLLGVRLEKPGAYALGDRGGRPDATTIRSARQLLDRVALLAASLGLAACTARAVLLA